MHTNNHHSVTTFNSEEPLVSSHLVQVLNAAVEFVWFTDFKREALHVWIWWWSFACADWASKREWLL